MCKYLYSVWFVTDSNIAATYTNAACSSDAICQSTRSPELDPFILSFINPVLVGINPCCGLLDTSEYYSLDNGPCLPCELTQ